MALMFPRLARNFARNGYFPTDEPTLERTLSALRPADGPMAILDPWAATLSRPTPWSTTASALNTPGPWWISVFTAT